MYSLSQREPKKIEFTEGSPFLERAGRHSFKQAKTVPNQMAKSKSSSFEMDDQKKNVLEITKSTTRKDRPKTGIKLAPCKCKACTLKREEEVPEEPEPRNNNKMPMKSTKRDISPSKALRLGQNQLNNEKVKFRKQKSKKSISVFEDEQVNFIEDPHQIETIKETLRERDGTELDFVKVNPPSATLPERLGTGTTCCSSFIFEEQHETEESTLTESFFKFLDFSSEDIDEMTLKNDCDQSKEVYRNRLGSRVENNGCCIGWKRGPLLGRGAFGTVWCGLTMTGELIAVKQTEIVSADLSKAQREYEAIQCEVAVLKSLRHENVVGYLGTSFEARIVSIFMQFIPGGTVSGILKKFGSLAESVFARYTKQTIEAVTYLHAKSVIHRDIKGSNLMLMPCGIIKLIDFGCAKRILSLDMSNDDIMKSMKGTPYWMSPEVINGTGYGRKSDIWSIGCSVFEMATARPPWAHLNKFAALYAISTGVSVPKLSDKFSTEAKEFVSSCLIRDPDKRPECFQLRNYKFLNPDQNMLDATIHDRSGMPRNSAVKRKIPQLL